MNHNIKKMLASIAHAPGVYFFKNRQGMILYIGKAKNLHNRISSYFIKQAHDWKLAGLLSEFNTIETIVTNTEIEASLLEAKLIGTNKPKYNTLLKEGNPFVYIVTKTDGHLPDLDIVRTQPKKEAYFGPFLQKKDARNAIDFLKNSFMLYRCNKKIPNGCLDFHLGRCAGTCKSNFDVDSDKLRMSLAIDVLKHDTLTFIDTIKAHIKTCSARLEYEKARNLQQYLEQMNVIFATIKTKFSFEKYTTDLTHILYTKQIRSEIADSAEQLQLFVHTKEPVRTVDCFDISHFQGQHIVGSCIRFTDGKPEQNKFRRFLVKTITEQNDYAALQEIVQRRYKNNKDIPDLIVIDGGKGQLSVIKDILPHTTIISLAKREERIFGIGDPEGIKPDIHNKVGKILIAIRDYTHHFAITFHRLRRKNSFLKK